MDSKKNRIGNISNLLSDKLHTENMDRWLDFRTLGSPSGFSTVDFWEWYASYSIDSSVRGALAEFLVMKALGIEQRRSHWGKCDLVSGSFSFEIKSSAKITCKHPESGAISENKRIVFDIADRHHHITGDSWSEKERCSDMYIFCFLCDLPVTNTDNWEFYPVLTSDINASFGHAKTVSLSRIRELSDPVSFQDLRTTVNKISGGVLVSSTETQEEKERQEQVQELQRLLACYQVASRDDKNVVWAALNKYMPYVN